ncbi:hypothetical protein BP5796_09888 [Coleophoma crateriformis]|uniref:S-adenosyl-L-methionine-dependent methyltransferase n=1 Tax=Coleophoma crateriformis TaxID=565419 RepID=A0A3D8QTN2_9HELO|nr:hypothetical protein BP5796_09888 [Coleophoma crateriformis]
MASTSSRPGPSLSPETPAAGERRNSAGQAIETTPQELIEPGDDADSFSDFEDDAPSTGSTSIASSIRGHVFDNGRRYHKFRQGKYAMPNDEQEQDREDMKHAAVQRVCDGRLIFAPIGDSPQNIVDLGTGTGIWAIEVGDQFPSATVTGLDLSPIQPAWVPPNVKFLVDDVEDEFLYPQDHFDLIHERHTLSHLRDVPQLIRRCYDHLKPGGWIEFQDHEITAYCDDGTMPPDFPVVALFDFVQQGMAKFGFDCTSMLTVDEKLRAAGFTNITRTIYKIPSGPWPRDRKMKMIGYFWRTVLYEGLGGISAKTIGQGLGWPQDELEVYLVGVRKALMDPAVHSYWKLHIVTAQKPQ